MQYRHHAIVDKILASRAAFARDPKRSKKAAEEGGCGVTGFLASVPVSGRHIHKPSVQMHNRGNGKGGGVAAVGLSAQDLGVTQQVLDSHYLLQVALLDPDARQAVEAACISPYLEVHKAGGVPSMDDYRAVEGLEVKPPDVWRYFVRVKNEALDRFMDQHGLQDMDRRKAEDEFIFQNSMRINQRFYASLGEQRAFVLSHGRNMMILKLVGYAEKVVEYYLLDDFKAHGWIAHQRYPTKGRVWHPGGAHPFSGMDEALVHNGDFANYHAVCEYLKQHNIYPQFLTDTEVAVLLLDLLNRTFGYPLEYVIEALAPTTEHDFDQLPVEKQRIYRAIQSSHIHASPDGPWFFIIARNNPYENAFQLIGITDTAMLRPQVFALQQGQVQIGLVCSEKQAIDATLQSLAAEDDRFCPVADKYWNARGGSATDGGAFMFTVTDAGRGDGAKQLVCTNKFGEPVRIAADRQVLAASQCRLTSSPASAIRQLVREGLAAGDTSEFKKRCIRHLKIWDDAAFTAFCSAMVACAGQNDTFKRKAIEVLSHLHDSKPALGPKKPSAVIHRINESLVAIFKNTPQMDACGNSMFCYIDWRCRGKLRPPGAMEKILVLNAGQFPPEGDECDAKLIGRAYEKGWRRFICFGYRGQRFTGCGLMQKTNDVRIDVYGSSGDYLASGIDGLEIYVHGDAQDQLGQIIKSGKLVVYGDVGQTFMYGAKGGEVYVLGNAAGRPLINAVGRPRVVINGTCLDYLAESFMAGDPLNGGGFVILNGVGFDGNGRVAPLAHPYPGANLFSLASGGAIYLRDPYRLCVDGQLNSGQFSDLTPGDWEAILPYLQENERLFGISIENDLLKVNKQRQDYATVYRKVSPLLLET